VAFGISVVLEVVGVIVVVVVIDPVYSFEWGREKSTAWLTAFLLSFFESVIFIQPVKVKSKDARCFCFDMRCPAQYELNCQL